MALLVERARAADAEMHSDRAAAGLPPVPSWLRHLPEQMILDGDEDLVDMTAILTETARIEASEPKPRTPRTYRPASHWRAELQKIDAALAAETGRSRLGTADLAAYGGIGVRRTPRQRRRDHAAMDRSIERTARLIDRRKTVAWKLALAEKREESPA
jgi:hypothetical protein